METYLQIDRLGQIYEADEQDDERYRERNEIGGK
jgi:hypothetical protein